MCIRDRRLVDTTSVFEFDLESESDLLTVVGWASFPLVESSSLFMVVGGVVVVITVLGVGASWPLRSLLSDFDSKPRLSVPGPEVP